ncbi:MAG: TonB-dependent receptor [Caulobacterales bacterium]|nr:TonB-dependent receptor [Caulobacterales bacterium]
MEPKRYSEALLDLAQQANVTLIGADACEGVSLTTLAVDATLEQALGQLLAGAPCTWRMVAAGTVEISRPAHAESPPLRPPPPVTVSELLVTATKRAQDPRQLAVAVSAIPRSQLEGTGATDLDEAAGQFAGVLATNLGPGRNKLLLRGLSDGAYTGRARSTVATYLDDLPLNYNAPDPDLRLVDVERVEVARGPQGALFGAGSMSGVYRIVAQKPDLRRFGAGARLSGSTTYGGAPSESLDGYLNAPLWGVVGVRLSGYEEIQGGYLDDTNLQRNNVDRTERRGARLMVLAEPAEGWSINLTAAGQHLRSDDTHYTTPGLGLKRADRIAEPHVNDIEFATGTIRKSWGWGELTSSSGFVRHAYSSLYDATAVQDRYTALAKTSAYSEQTHTKMFVQDIYLTSRGARRVQWLAGLYGEYTLVHSPSQLLAQNPNLPNVEVYGDDRRDHVREVAAYGEVSYRLAPRWIVAAGGRLFATRARTISDVVSERFPPRSLDRSANLNGFSPKVSLQYALEGGNLLYASYSEGYRAGGINSGGALPLPAQREIFKPDRLRNLEGGVKLQTPAKRLALNVAAFYDLWTDIQTDQFRASGIPYTTNAGDARILGLEAELAYNLTPDLFVQLDGRLSHARTVNSNPDFSSQLVDGLPGAPAVSGGALVSYQRPLGHDWLLRLTGEANYVGRSRVTFDATFPKMGGYVRTKLLAEISHGKVGVQAYLTNPFNSFSDTFAFGNPFNPALTRQITPQRPRTVGVTLFAAY